MRAQSADRLDPRDAEIAQLKAAIGRALELAQTAFRTAHGNTGVVDLACDLRNCLAPKVGRR